MRLEIIRPDNWTLNIWGDYAQMKEIADRFLKNSGVTLPEEMEIETLEPLERKCPACKAEPGRLCVLPNGKTRKVFHTRRNR